MYINQVLIGLNTDPYLIEPTLFATAGGTSTALTAGITNFSLVSGAFVHVKVGTVGNNATLNVNSTGAKDIYYNGELIKAGILTSNNIYTFIYDGTKWNIVGDITGKNILINSTAGWNLQSNYVAPSGTIIIYTDRGTYTNNNITITVPGIKISDGSAYVTSLPFVGDDIAAAIRSELDAHASNTTIHVTTEEKTFWNNKLNCSISDEILQFNRL